MELNAAIVFGAREGFSLLNVFLLQEMRSIAISKPLELNELESGISSSIVNVKVRVNCIALSETIVQ